MRFLVLTIFLFTSYSTVLFAEEPGGWIEPGGYDPKWGAEEEKRKAHAALLALEDEKKKAKANEAKMKQQAKTNYEAAKLKQEKGAPDVVENLDDDKLCLLYGQSVRNEKLSHSKLNMMAGNVRDLLRKQIINRNLSVSEDTAKKHAIRIGSTECELLAGYGLPSHKNRSVGSWGTHIQWVYGGTYIYSENGKVTSWQD